MDIVTSFQRRMDCMYNDATPHTLKRKRYYCTPNKSERNGCKTLFLGSFEKRKKDAQWEAITRTDTRGRLFPTSVRSVLCTNGQDNENVLGLLPSCPILPFAPPHLPSKAITEVVGPYLLPERGSGEPQFALCDLKTESPSILKEFALLHKSHLQTMALLGAKNREYGVLLRKDENLEEFSTGAKALERYHANNLKQDLKLEEFKKHVNSLTGSASVYNEARRTHECRDRSVLRQDPNISPREIFRSSSIFEVLGAQILAGDMSHSRTLADEGNMSGSDGCDDEQALTPAWKRLLGNVNQPSRIEKRTSLDKEIELSLSKLKTLQLERGSKFKAEAEPEVDRTLVDAFKPLSEEAEKEVNRALGGSNRSEVLVSDEKSNIDVTRGIIQCLVQGTWLNDEVINVYMELLKERELREPNRFVKCHFFNTFFYNKLFKDKHSYDYKAIRRWTTQKRLGYSLSDCEKILVPIHQNVHWCLAVINIRDKKLEYLDSLKGGDDAVLGVLARYIADEVKDKDGQVWDMRTWEQEFPQEIPEQGNGCDCGMFMIKYADFHSRGAPLHFTQKHMEYFRRKLVWEILHLKAT